MVGIGEDEQLGELCCDVLLLLHHPKPLVKRQKPGLGTHPQSRLRDSSDIDETRCL